jgi:hypothetical protein
LIAWFGPRGLSTLLLVLLAVFADVSEAEQLFAIASLVVLLSVVLHGGGTALLMRRRAEPLVATARGSSRRSSLPIAVSRAAPPAIDSSAVPERITMDELKDLLARNEPVILGDVRTDRTYRNDAVRARGAVRLPSEDAVRTARELGLAQHATLVLYCA